MMSEKKNMRKEKKEKKEDPKVGEGRKAPFPHGATSAGLSFFFVK